MKAVFFILVQNIVLFSGQNERKKILKLDGRRKKEREKCRQGEWIHLTLLLFFVHLMIIKMVWYGMVRFILVAIAEIVSNYY